MQRDDRVPAREVTRRLQRLTVAIERRAQQYTEELCHHLEAFVAEFIVTIDRQVRDRIVVGGHSHAFDISTDEHFEYVLRPDERFDEHEVRGEAEGRWERVHVRRHPRHGQPVEQRVQQPARNVRVADDSRQLAEQPQDSRRQVQRPRGQDRDVQPDVSRRRHGSRRPSPRRQSECHNSRTVNNNSRDVSRRPDSTVSHRHSNSRDLRQVVLSRPEAQLQVTQGQTGSQETRGGRRRDRRPDQGPQQPATWVVRPAASIAHYQARTGTPPPSYESLTVPDPYVTADSGTQDLRSRLTGQRAKRPANANSREDDTVQPPPRQQRQQPIPCGPETGAISRTQAAQGQRPPAGVLPIVDTGPDQVGPIVTFSQVHPGPVDGRLTIVARNPGNLGRPERFIFQEFYLPNPAAPGWVAYTGAASFTANPASLQPEVRRVHGPPAIQPFDRVAEPEDDAREASPVDGGNEYEECQPRVDQPVEQAAGEARDGGHDEGSDAASRAAERQEDK